MQERGIKIDIVGLKKESERIDAKIIDLTKRLQECLHYYSLRHMSHMHVPRSQQLGIPHFYLVES